MNGMRKLLCLLGSVVLAAFALPAEAAKVYTLNMSSPSPLLKGVAGQQVVATYANISTDTGNSNVSSLKLYAPSGITIKTPATSNGSAVPIGPGYTGIIQNFGTSIWVGNIQPPLKPFAATKLALTMTVDVNCSATGTGWTSRPTGTDQVWNGSNFSGQTFLFTNVAPNTSQLDTPVSGHCGTISFVNQPATTFAGYPITTTVYNNPTGNPVTVSLVIDGSPAPDGTPVTLAVSAGTCTISSGASATTSAGTATWDTIINPLKMTAGTSCKLTASGGGVPQTAASTSNAFDIVGPAGTLSCDPNALNNSAGNLDPLSATPPSGSPDWGLVRGLNTTGDCGADVPWTFSINTTDKTFTFIEDSLGQSTSVEYVVLWPEVSADADGWAGKQPCVSWGVTNPTFTPDATYGCKGDYEPALFCLSSDVDAGTAVMPYIPNVPPYNLATTEAQYQPFLSDGITPQKAKVCVAQQGMTSDNGLVQYWTKFIDQADTWGKLP